MLASVAVFAVTMPPRAASVQLPADRSDERNGRFEGLGLKRYAQGALFFGMGGVGLYPAHVHVDSGSVRKWGEI